MENDQPQTKWMFIKLISLQNDEVSMTYVIFFRSKNICFSNYSLIIIKIEVKLLRL